MRQAIVLGTGGNARAIISIIKSVGKHDIAHILELVKHRPDEIIMGKKVEFYSSILDKYEDRSSVDIFLAIGANEERFHWWSVMRDLGFNMPSLISPYAIVDPTARFGDANIVCPRAFVGPEANLGVNNLINTGAIMEHEAVIGDHCHLAPLSIIAGRVRVGDFCFLGLGSKVIDGLSVASNTTLGAGAVLVGDICESAGVYIGVPALRMGCPL